MPAPDVSVIIPSYNHARFIEEAARSVLSQEDVQVELIVIDDGSSDDSVERMQRLAAEDARVSVHTQPNGGSHSAINHGLSRATAPWLAILNSDDIWHPSRLKRMLAAAEESGDNFLFSDSQLIDADGAEINDAAHWWNFSTERMRERVRTHGVADGLLYGNLTVSTSNFLFRRELLTKVGTFHRFRYNLDWDYVLRCVDEKGVRVGFVDERLLRYRLHGNNAILSGMPGAAVEAQLITRQVYRRRLRAPESLLLSHHRHDRLLRRYLQGQIRNYRASFEAVEEDRDGLAALINQRQEMVEAERAEAKRVQAQYRAELQACEAGAASTQAALQAEILAKEQQSELQEQALREQSERELAALRERTEGELASQREHAEGELASQREHAERELTSQRERSEQALLEQREAAGRELRAVVVESLEVQAQLQRSYASGIHARVQRDQARCREVRMLDHLEGRDRVGRPPDSRSRAFIQRVMRAVRSQRRINESINFLSGGMPVGSVRVLPRDPMPMAPMEPRIAAHLHVYYLDLAPELIADALRIPGLERVVITGPWSREDMAQALVPIVDRGIDLRVLVVPNRGKDVGGLVAAIQQGALLDSDLVLKLHSKKSHNAETYFQAISALFGTEIRDGEQWRRELIQPLAGSAWQINTILKLFNDDPAIGMVGARPFITNVGDANAALSQAVYERFGVPQGLPFVAGTMFWVRSSVLRPLLDRLSLDEFSLDSREVEGGLEHIMERLLGALVLADGYDVYGVDV
ncbi:glycosyltransferase [Stenotrophomonas sp. SORGH_AS_0282]|uniref:glycosyltransferase n=1 Tax=Stenotrophomonas sp. SORGH_AS_0282 TaxID=3041763 RepID=UPI002784ECC1|nr:glycosyltransferase [Stenotrophomonas sp. SORGH_AS_0282]MDQ1063953.1 glycosyltransferase involved in cell wall biosynthesis [Stenotrophomonas sp. SORGH_AS_0282]MDQ1187679.1 glycosyltransferase involved in cell wall biosynthesis [Stenotrophomonas sp. SORGH_AS_0282]